MVDEGLFAAAIEYHPFVVVPVEPENAGVSLRNEHVRRLLFSERAVDCAASGNNQLLDKNEGSLLLDIGRVGARGMTESRLSTTNATARWRRIAADLKRGTRAGMIGTNERSGASAKCRSYRYTPSAADMEEAGTPLRPFEQSPNLLRPDR